MLYVKNSKLTNAVASSIIYIQEFWIWNALASLIWAYKFTDLIIAFDGQL